MVEMKIMNALDNAKVSTALCEEETDEEESGSKRKCLYQKSSIVPSVCMISNILVQTE